MKFFLCFGIMLAFVTERALSQQYLLGKLPIQTDGRNFGGLLDPVTTRLSSLETSVAPLTSGLAALQNQVAAFPSQVANLQSQVSPLQSLPNQVATLGTKLTADEALIATTQANITALQTQLSSAKADAAAANATANAAKAAADAATTSVTAANATANAAKTAADAAKVVADAAKADAAAVNVTANAAKTAADAAKVVADAAKAAADALATALPKCLTTPSTVAATFIAAYQKCYSLESSVPTYNAAQLKCMQQGGTLAEPLYTDTTFYQNLIDTFTAAKVTTVAGSTGLYVGVSMHTDGANFNYAYNSNGALIPKADPIWLPTLPALLVAPTPPAVKVAFIPTPPGTPATWKLNGEDPGTTARGFVCQYPVW